MTSSAIVRDPSWVFESLAADESGKCRVNVPDSLIFRRVRARGAGVGCVCGGDSGGTKVESQQLRDARSCCGGFRAVSTPCAG